MGSCCCAEKPKKEEGTHAQLQEDKTQATERQDVQQSAEQQQKVIMHNNDGDVWKAFRGKLSVLPWVYLSASLQFYME